MQLQHKDRPWNQYPLGTLAHAITGGYWERVANGWQWPGGCCFPRPGGDAVGACMQLPEAANAAEGVSDDDEHTR